MASRTLVVLPQVRCLDRTLPASVFNLGVESQKQIRKNKSVEKVSLLGGDRKKRALASGRTILHFYGYGTATESKVAGPTPACGRPILTCVHRKVEVPQ